MRRRLRPLHQEGLDGVFSNDNDIEEIIIIVTKFNKNDNTKFGAATRQ